MISKTDSRLAVAVLFLSLISVLFAFELGVTARLWGSKKGRALLSVEKKAPKWLIRLTQFLAPVTIGLLGAIIIPLAFAGKLAELDPATRAKQCHAEVDADIGGAGIRIAIWVQESVLLFIALLGTFHCSATGAKEIGAGLALTHISLAFALLVQRGRSTLTPADAILGSMILDSQGSALSIQLVAKETLAARWQVMVIIVCQLFGLVSLPIFVSGFVNGEFSPGEGCSCITVFWWGWLSNCLPSSPREGAIFWVYYSGRCVAFLQCCYHSLSNTVQFHDAEKYGTRLKGITYATLASPDLVLENSEPAQYEKRIKGITYATLASSDNILDHSRPAQGREKSEPQAKKPEGSRYSKYPATISLMYVVYGMYALTSMASAEIAMRDFRLRPSSQVFSVGQIISIVVAGATMIRAMYLLTGMILAVGGGFNWPFSLEVAKEAVGFRRRATGSFVLISGEGDARFPQVSDIPEQYLALGNIIKKKEALYEPLMRAKRDSLNGLVTSVDGADAAGSSFGEQTSVEITWCGILPLIFRSLSITKLVISWGRERRMSLAASDVKEEYFQPTQEFLTECMKDSKVRKALKWRAAYMITGLKIGTDLKLTEYKKTNKSIQMNDESQTGTVTEQLSNSTGTEIENERMYAGRVIFAYQLSLIEKPWFSNWVKDEVLIQEGSALAFN